MTDPAPEPATDAVLGLAAIIREVGSINHRHGAAALAEAILSHPAAREVFAATTPPAGGEAIGPEWRPCVKLPITVHVREQRPGETHVSTREGITPVNADDLIMRGVQGEEYPIGRELFNRTYRLGPAPASAESTAPPADGEAEELAANLESVAIYLSDTGCDGYADYVNSAADYVEHAAALLRQLPPAGLQAIRYCVADDGAVIQRTSKAPESWAVRSCGYCMSHTGEWEIEPQPSNRTDEWLATHRWPTVAAAWEALQQNRQGEESDD